MTKYASITASVLAATFLVFYFLSNVSDPIGIRCDKLGKIASDVGNMAYLRDWAGSRTRDPEVLKHLGYSGSLHASDAPIAFKKIDVDWEYLGIDAQFAFVSVSRSSVSAKNVPKDETTVESVSFGEGRSSIVILAEGFQSIAISGIGENAGSVTEVTDDVIVICE